MNPLAQAIERRDWEQAARLLLLGMSRAAQRLPPETLEALIDLLSDAEPPGGRDER